MRAFEIQKFLGPYLVRFTLLLLDIFILVPRISEYFFYHGCISKSNPKFQQNLKCHKKQDLFSLIFCPPSISEFLSYLQCKQKHKIQGRIETTSCFHELNCNLSFLWKKDQFLFKVVSNKFTRFIKPNLLQQWMDICSTYLWVKMSQHYTINGASFTSSLFNKDGLFPIWHFVFPGEESSWLVRQTDRQTGGRSIVCLVFLEPSYQRELPLMTASLAHCRYQKRSQEKYGASTRKKGQAYPIGTVGCIKFFLAKKTFQFSLWIQFTINTIFLGFNKAIQ